MPKPTRVQIVQIVLLSVVIFVGIKVLFALLVFCGHRGDWRVDGSSVGSIWFADPNDPPHGTMDMIDAIPIR